MSQYNETEKLDVFACKRSGGYSGGVIVVAANSIEEAIGTAIRDGYKYEIDQYYQYNDWERLNGVVAYFDKPKVLIEDGYSE